jgi:hypothetical protein
MQNHTDTKTTAPSIYTPNNKKEIPVMTLHLSLFQSGGLDKTPA